MKDWKTYALALVLVLTGCSPTAPAAPRPSASPAVEAILQATPRLAAVAAAPLPSAAPMTPTAWSAQFTPTPDATAPHGDGDFIIGAHIAAGRWQSDGAAEGECYWTTRKANGIILKSFIGQAGGIIELGGYDYEVQFRNCGTWYYLGP